MEEDREYWMQKARDYKHPTRFERLKSFMSNLLTFKL